MKVVKYDNSFYRVISTKNGCLKLSPIKVETLEKSGKAELLERFSNEELMQMILDRLEEKKNA